MKIAAVVPSAGRGIRIKFKEAKPYLKLDRRPILIHTLKALNNFSCIDEIIVAVDRTNKTRAENIIKKYRISKLKAVVQGGATRFRSVLNCLKHLSDDVDYVVIHDGVRPFITEDLVRKAIKVAKKVGACVAGVPLVPTVKKINKHLRIIATPSRRQFWIAQTPQVFKKTIIIKAYNMAQGKKVKPTDDSMLVESLGRRVKMVMGSYRNIKITTPEDLELAKILVKRKNK